MHKSPFVIGILVLMIMILAFLVIQQNASSPVQSELSVEKTLPWQIKMVDGNPSVFGLTLQKSQLSDAAKIIGPDFELAILSKPGQPEALELFTGNFRSGSLTGSLILVADINPEQVKQLREQFDVPEQHLETGTKKTTLRFEQQQAGLPYTIKSITFIPVARLDREIIEQRFGKPGQILKTAEKVTSYLYPQQGLNIIIDESGKDFLQYVSPGVFGSLQQDLHRQAEKYSQSLRAE
jgi:hypothetical protein